MLRGGRTLKLREALIALACVLALLSALPAQEQRSGPSFSGLSTPLTTAATPADGALNSELTVYSEGTELHADVDVSGGNLAPGDVYYARPEKYPWRLAAVIGIEFTTYMQKMAHEMKNAVGDLETLEPATIDYLKNSLPAELEARMRHIIMQQQLMAAGPYRLLAVDPTVPTASPFTSMPPVFYTDAAGALQILRELSQTLKLSILSREAVLFDIVTAVLMSKASPIRQALGHLLDPAKFPPDPKQESIVTRLGKEGLPRIVVGVGGYTIGALAILAYSMTQHGFLGYDLDFNRLRMSHYLLKTDKYGFGWRVDTQGFGFDNVNAGLELSTEHLNVAVLAGGKVSDGRGHLFAAPQTTILASYKLFEDAGPAGVASGLALLAEADLPWYPGYRPRLGLGLLYDAKLPSASDVDKRLILDGGAAGPVSDLDWHAQGTLSFTHKDAPVGYFFGAGVGNERVVAPQALHQYDTRQYGGPGTPPQVYGYGFFGITF